MNLDIAGEERLVKELRWYWHPVLYASDLREKRVAVTLLGERVADLASVGEVATFKDL